MGASPPFLFKKNQIMSKVKLNEALIKREELQDLIKEKEEFIISQSKNKDFTKELAIKELKELELLRLKSIDLKLIINKANSDNYENIFKLSELKSEKKFLKTIDTGTPVTISKFQKYFKKESATDIFLNKDFVISKVRDINKEITLILEKIDKFNNKVEVKKIW